MDEGALYRDAATLLIYQGVREVGLVSPEAARSGYQDGDDLTLRKRPGRTKYGNITLSTGDYDTDDDNDALPTGMRKSCDEGEPYCWDVQSFSARAYKTVGSSCPEGGNRCLISALDSPELHLGGATELSNDVKFKAGAELSKAVNYTQSSHTTVLPTSRGLSGQNRANTVGASANRGDRSSGRTAVAARLTAFPATRADRGVEARSV